MRKKYNIQMNPKRLSKEDIAKHKDFNALYSKFQSLPKSPSPVYRRMSFWIVAAAAAAAMLLLYVGVNQINAGNYEKRMASYFDNSDFINPPFDQVQKTFASYDVDVNQGGVFEYPSGSKLFVPAAAFTDKAGNPVGGQVTIKYREMHDFVDFFMSGIPMTYDSAGVNYILESAGMIEIFAEKDGKKVNMAPGKSINVELVSQVNVSPNINIPPGYNIYRLDEEKRNWVYQTIDKMQVIEEQMSQNLPNENDPFYPATKELKEKLQTLQINQENELAKVENSLPKPKLPIKPIKANPNDYVFDLDFNDLKDPNASGDLAAAQGELEALYKQYEKMLWRLSGEAGITPQQLQQGFSNVTDIKIQKLDNSTYELMLKKGDDKLNVKVNPVLSGSDYDKAMADFNRDFDRYQKELSQREANLKDQKEAIKQKFEEEKRLANLTFNERIDELRKSGMEYAAMDEIIKRKVVNRFTASGFGIWNCDRPLPPNRLILAANFKNENGQSYKNKTAYLVDKSRNTVYQFLAEDGAELNIDLNAQNLLWLVTDDNKIAVIRPDDFKGITKETKEHDFVMQKVNKEINDEKDVRDILFL